MIKSSLFACFIAFLSAVNLNLNAMESEDKSENMLFRHLEKFTDHCFEIAYDREALEIALTCNGLEKIIKFYGLQIESEEKIFSLFLEMDKYLYFCGKFAEMEEFFLLGLEFNLGALSGLNTKISRLYDCFDLNPGWKLNTILQGYFMLEEDNPNTNMDLHVLEHEGSGKIIILGETRAPAVAK